MRNDAYCGKGNKSKSANRLAAEFLRRQGYGREARLLENYPIGIGSYLSIENNGRGIMKALRAAARYHNVPISGVRELPWFERNAIAKAYREACSGKGFDAEEFENRLYDASRAISEIRHLAENVSPAEDASRFEKPRRQRQRMPPEE